MGAYINSSSEIGGRVLIGAWVLKGRNTEYILKTGVESMSSDDELSVLVVYW